MLQQEITFREVGNHWYPNINHEAGDNISLSSDIEQIIKSNICRELSYLGEVRVILVEIGDILNANQPVILFNEEDIVRYLYYNKEDPFDMRFTVLEKQYYISDTVYRRLEENFNLNFHKTLYYIDFY